MSSSSVPTSSRLPGIASSIPDGQPATEHSILKSLYSFVPSLNHKQIFITVHRYCGEDNPSSHKYEARNPSAPISCLFSDIEMDLKEDGQFYLHKGEGAEPSLMSKDDDNTIKSTLFPENSGTFDFFPRVRFKVIVIIYIVTRVIVIIFIAAQNNW